MDLQDAWRDVIRPTMIREPKTPGNRGVEVVMVDLNGDGIPASTTGTGLAKDDCDCGDAIVGYETTTGGTTRRWCCHVAHLTGGSDQTIYRWRLQKRDDADSSWQNYSWTMLHGSHGRDQYHLSVGADSHSLPGQG